MAKPIPIIILSDSPDCASGLARITNDIAIRLYKSGLNIRVATAGFNGSGARDLPYIQYQCGNFANSADIPKALPAIADWLGDEQGILFTIYDIHRLEAFRFAQAFGGPWAAYLGQKKPPFYLAGYVPIDSHSEQGMAAQSRECLRAFDKLLAYGPYGKKVLDKCLDQLSGNPKPSSPKWLPHGINTKVFKPQLAGSGRARMRRAIDSGLKDENNNPIPRILEVLPEHKLLGAVGTNQSRKDWGSFFKIAAGLPDSWRFWVHTDRQLAAWSIPDLIEQHNLSDRVFMTLGGLPDEIMAELYSDCDYTIGIGLGEGFGYPIIESLACGTPCLHIDYAGGADLIPDDFKISLDMGTRTDGPYCLERPIILPNDFINRIEFPGAPQFDCVSWASKYEWDSLWKNSWLPWWKETIQDFESWRGNDQGRN